MGSKLLAIAMVLSCFASAAAQALNTTTLRQSELSKHSFGIAQLSLTVQKFKRNGFSPYIGVRVENLSDNAIVFDPQVLSLVSKGNEQVNTGSTTQGTTPVPARKVLPGAFIVESYLLDHPVELPARLYYDGKQLAVITE